MVAPVETGDTDFVARMASAIVSEELNTGDVMAEEFIVRQLASAGVVINDSPTYITTYDNRVSIEELLMVLEFLVTSKGVQVALLDNLNFFLEVTRADEQIIEMDRAVHELVMFCKKHPVHILLIVHPKKTVNGRVESEFDIKGSSTAVQEAANVILFNRPTEKDVNDGFRKLNDRELVFKKIRKRGQYVNKPIWIKYEKGRYSECHS